MSDEEKAALIEALDALGLQLSVTSLVDGTLRLGRWRTMVYWANSSEADALWAKHIADDPARMSELAQFLLDRRRKAGAKS